MPFIIGTAGHIDHGKTALVKALTGQDTDRLEEEKARGISIDLGFAHLDLPDGTRAGVVDVPGHERFIRNMLAGAHGLDLVLLVVAADDGVMPQTEEHLRIVHLLGVRTGIVVITKIDLVDDARLTEVEKEVAVLTSGTSLDGAPIVRVSSMTGQGLDDLRAHLARMLTGAPEPAAEGTFRLPVDRAFLLQGHGLVVTGTALGGQVRVGDRVRAMPGGHAFRVRSLQVHGEPREVARRGQRVALNLSGDEAASIARGDTICHDGLDTTTRFDAVLDVRTSPPVRSHQRVHVHIGTADRLGSVVLLGEAVPSADGTAPCQIALTDPVVALRGDRFILRDETAQRTIGGGIVIDAWATRHRRREPGLIERLDRLRTGGLADVLRACLDRNQAFAVAVPPLARFANRSEAEVAAALGSMPDLIAFDLDGETLYAPEARWERTRDALLGALRAFHAAHPLSPGMDVEEARASVPGDVAPRLFRLVTDRLAAEQGLVREGSLLRLPTHRVQLRTEEQVLSDKVRALLGTTPLSPPDVKQLEAASAVARSRLVEVMRVMEREKAIVRASPELYFLRGAVDAAKAALRSRVKAGGDVTPPMFKELFDISRKHAIPLLELFDREGVTIRIGDKRRMR